VVLLFVVLLKCKPLEDMNPPAFLERWDLVDHKNIYMKYFDVRTWSGV
jgi:hypothetical protein